MAIMKKKTLSFSVNCELYPNIPTLLVHELHLHIALYVAVFSFYKIVGLFFSANAIDVSILYNYDRLCHYAIYDFNKITSGAAM